MTCYEYLLTYEYFTESELDLCIKGFGDNEETYDTMCQVRYAFDIDQLAMQDGITLSDYHN